MQQPQKRQKTSEELNLNDLAASIESLVTTVNRISQTYRYLLTTNTAVLSYYRKVHNKLKPADLETISEDTEVDE